MTTIERFVEFAGKLPTARLHDLEDALAGLMASYDEAYAFSAAECSEIDRRLADRQPGYSSPQTIADLLSRA